LPQKSDYTDRRKGTDAKEDKETRHDDTLFEGLNQVCRSSERPTNAPTGTPILDICEIEGVDDVLGSRVEHGVAKLDEEGILLPTRAASDPCTGKEFTGNMHQR